MLHGIWWRIFLLGWHSFLLRQRATWTIDLLWSYKTGNPQALLCSFHLTTKDLKCTLSPLSCLSIIQCELENTWISWLSYLGSWFWCFDFYSLKKAVIPICRLLNSFTPLSSGIRGTHYHISSGSWNGIVLNSYISESYLQIHMEMLNFYYRLVFLTVLWSDPTEYYSLE